jgi:ABC-type antimicrobial peptide transport system permease subunit
MGRMTILYGHPRVYGIRMALGSQRRAVVNLILRETLYLVGITVAVTVPVSMAMTLALRSQLFNVSSTDVYVYAVGITTIVLVAALAGLIPARRAASIDPARALHTE